MARFPERPSAWGGLANILDTPAKRWTAIAVILAAMAVAPFLFGQYGTVILTNALLYVLLANSYLGPTFALIQGLAPMRLRALWAAITLLVINLIGLGLGW